MLLHYHMYARKRRFGKEVDKTISDLTKIGQGELLTKTVTLFVKDMEL